MGTSSKMPASSTLTTSIVQSKDLKNRIFFNVNKHKILCAVSSIVPILRCHLCINTLSFLSTFILENLVVFYFLTGLPADSARLVYAPKRS